MCREDGSVRVADVLKRKGATVATLAESASVRDLIGVLVDRGIGSVVVLSHAGSVAGLVSERDVVSRLHEAPEQLLEQPIRVIMNVDVVVCGPMDSVDSVLQTMTERRIRHVPVLQDGRLVGLVSIGDLVKSRIDDLSHERDQMSAYIRGSSI
jgi:CBS domain-containing protein